MGAALEKTKRKLKIKNLKKNFFKYKGLEPPPNTVDFLTYREVIKTTAKDGRRTGNTLLYESYMKQTVKVKDAHCKP